MTKRYCIDCLFLSMGNVLRSDTYDEVTPDLREMLRGEGKLAYVDPKITIGCHKDMWDKIRLTRKNIKQQVRIMKKERQDICAFWRPYGKDTDFYAAFQASHTSKNQSVD